MSKVTVYGADWCGMTTRTLAYLDSVGVAYEYIDVEQDAGASDWVKSHNGGLEKKPTVAVGELIVSEPSDAELESLLREQKLLV